MTHSYAELRSQNFGINTIRTHLANIFDILFRKPTPRILLSGVNTFGLHTLAPMFSLLLPCCLSAITWFVISMIVEPIQGHAFRAFAHVAMESLKTGLPLLTHRNSSSSVKMKIRILRIIATAFGVLPRSIRSSAAHAMDSISLRHAFSHVTTAANISCELSSRNRHDIAAVASTHPKINTAFFISQFLCNQSSVTHPCSV